MNVETEVVKINGVDYVPASKAAVMAKKRDNMPYCIIRTYSAGVFAGYVESRNGQEVVMRDARRLWFWKGAASLSQMAMEGVSKPESCKFPCEVDKVELLQAIEVLDCTEKAKECLRGVEIWKE